MSFAERGIAQLRETNTNPRGEAVKPFLESLRRGDREISALAAQLDALRSFSLYLPDHPETLATLGVAASLYDDAVREVAMEAREEARVEAIASARADGASTNASSASGLPLASSSSSSSSAASSLSSSSSSSSSSSVLPSVPLQQPPSLPLSSSLGPSSLTGSQRGGGGVFPGAVGDPSPPSPRTARPVPGLPGAQPSPRAPRNGAGNSNGNERNERNGGNGAGNGSGGPQAADQRRFPCDHCGLPVSAARFAPHLEKCMGLGGRGRTGKRMGRHVPSYPVQSYASGAMDVDEPQASKSAMEGIEQSRALGIDDDSSIAAAMALDDGAFVIGSDDDNLNGVGVIDDDDDDDYDPRG